MDIKKLLRNSLENSIYPGRSFRGGLSGSSAALFLACIDEPLLVVAADERQAEILKNDILFYGQFFSMCDVEVLPAAEETRLAGIQARILHTESSIKKIVSHPEAVLSLLPSPDELEKNLVKLVKKEMIDREDLIRRFRALGYREVSVVAQEGDFSVRNWVIDIFPAAEEFPVRVEFFGDEIESVRYFRIDTQRSADRIEEIIIYPAVPRESGDNWSPFIERVRNERTLFDIDGVLRNSGDHGHITTLSFISGDGGESSFLSFAGTGILSAERKSVEDIVPVLKVREEETLIVLPHAYQAKRMRELFEKKGMSVPVLEKEALEGHPGKIAIMTGSLSEGIFTKGLMILTQKEIFGKEIVLARKVPEVGEKFLEKYEDIAAGDFVVHADHGIGRFKGLSRHRSEGTDVEVALVEYDENCLLYVPLYHIGKIHKFVAEEGFVPALDRLGGKTWTSRKVKARKKIDLMVAHLVELYARRETVRGFAASPDTEVHREFYSFFPYEETEDQLRAIREIVSDMESEAPMDRLLCGDVGFGKTEVAMRAAFKAVYDGGQVAVIVPTTILCEQHYRNFRERFAAFPVIIDFLSRFKTPAQSKKTVERIKNGEIDIIIGTSALLKRAIDFKHLILLIIDEEHRFGVAQKEKIKEIKKGVDCLMLSATPIPRTLQMALSGIRKMSVIETPPEERLAVRTIMARFDGKIIDEAVHKEVARGGQVFFVSDRVKEIEKLGDFLRELFPDIRIVTAHGQMQAKELEEIMIGFMNHEYDLLLSTNIIASGIDIPSANTIMVNMADRFGLADLYQLKGRVGRGSVKAYAYFLVNPSHVLTEKGRKRLKAIEQLSYLGAGLKLALKDLEIRGAGTLFGYEQSGHIHEIGFDMYLEMLKEEVDRLQGVAVEVAPEPEMDISVDAFIPRDYVPDEAVRFSLYRRMAGIESEKELTDLREELEDRFGRLPAETLRLLDVIWLRVVARNLHVDRLSLNNRSLSLSFRDDERISVEKMFKVAEEYKGIKYRERGFEFSLQGMDFSSGVHEMKNIFESIVR